MAFADPASGPRARPSTVNLAVYLLYAAAGIELINVVIGLAYAGAIADGTKKANEANKVADTGFGAVGGAASLVIGVVITAVLVLLAIYVGKGKQIARIFAWIVGGLAACCGFALFGLTLGAKSLYEAGRDQNPDMIPYDQYNDLVYADVPGWVQPVTTVLGILLVLALVGALILLALPASHPYFRKVEPQWEPPVPGAGGDPGYPGYPPAGGPPTV
jgi:hypothetical protein